MISRDDFGRATEFTYDSESRPIAKRFRGIDGSLTGSLDTVFNHLGRVESQHLQRVDGMGQSLPSQDTQFAYDTTGLLSALISINNGARIEFEVDTLDRTASTKTPNGALSTQLYDTRGNPLGVIDAGGNRTEQVRDDFDQVVGTRSPDTGAERLERDLGGHVVRRIREDSGVTIYRRNALGQLLERRSSSGELSRWTWDKATALVASITHGQSTEHFGYDEEGALIEHERLIDQQRLVTRYTHDTRGRILSKQLPDGQTLRYSYHKEGAVNGTLAVINRSDFLGLLDTPLVTHIDLEPRDGRSGWVAHNGIRTEWKFASNGQLSSLNSDALFEQIYGYDALGRLSTVDESGELILYGYNAGRLSQVITSQSLTEYDYDLAGNRTERRRLGSDLTLSTDRYRFAAEFSTGSGNRLIEYSVQKAADATNRKVTFHYGAGGMPTVRGEFSYTYDTERRPLSISRNGTLLAEYAYNGSGERVKKVIHSSGKPERTYYFYDDAQLAGEFDPDSGRYTHYVYLDDHRPVVKLDGDEVLAIHVDHLGTPRVMSDDEGEVVRSATYDAFGKATITEDEVSLPLRLAGQYFDTESGTHYNYFRDYDPETGRYLSSDPIMLAGGSHSYQYVSALPTMHIDPLGLRQTRPQRAYQQVNVNGLLNQMTITQLIQTIQTIQPSFTYQRITNIGGSAYSAQEVLQLSTMLQGYQLSELIQGFEPDFQLQGAHTQADLDVLANQFEAMTYIDHIRRTQDPNFAYSLTGVTDAYLDGLFEQATDEAASAQCTALYDPDYSGMTDIRALEQLIDGLPGQTAGIIIDGVWFPSENAARSAQAQYDLAGGEQGTGLSFNEWWNQVTAAYGPTTMAQFSTIGKINDVDGQTLGRDGDSTVLGNNMAEVGFTRPNNHDAHHIVAGGSTNADAARSRVVLEQFGIDINEAVNGVYLPHCTREACPPATAHSRVHTNAYYQEVLTRLLTATTATEARAILHQIARDLANGSLPF